MKLSIVCDAVCHMQTDSQSIIISNGTTLFGNHCLKNLHTICTNKKTPESLWHVPHCTCLTVLNSRAELIIIHHFIFAENTVRMSNCVLNSGKTNRIGVQTLTESGPCDVWLNDWTPLLQQYIFWKEKKTVLGMPKTGRRRVGIIDLEIK